MIKGLFGKTLTFLGILGLGYLAIPKQANAQSITFNGINYSKNAIITLTHPNGIDTVKAIAATYIPRKKGWAWARAPPVGWNLQPGDTVRIYATDSLGMNEQNTWRDVTGPSNLVIPLFANKPKNYIIAIRNVTDSDTLAEGKCRIKHNGNYSDGIVDTFNLVPSDYDFAFNLANSDSVWQWTNGGDWNQILGDSVFVEGRAINNNKTGSSKGVIQRYWTDGDVLPDITLQVVVEENRLENKVRETGSLIIRPNPAKNYIISTKEAILYDALGRPIKKIDKGKNNLDLNSGVYFIKKEDEVAKLVIYK